MARLPEFLGRLVPDILDLHIYGGLLLVAVGVGWVWRPGALIIAGVGLFGLGWFYGRSS